MEDGKKAGVRVLLSDPVKNPSSYKDEALLRARSSGT